MSRPTPPRLPCHKLQRFSAWGEALSALMGMVAGRAGVILRCPDCEGFHIRTRPLRYVQR